MAQTITKEQFLMESSEECDSDYLEVSGISAHLSTFNTGNGIRYCGVMSGDLVSTKDNPFPQTLDAGSASTNYKVIQCIITFLKERCFRRHACGLTAT